MERHHDNSLVGNATSEVHPSNGNIDRCVICDLKPESNSRIKFLHIYTHADRHRKLYEVIAQLLGFEVCLKTIACSIDMVTRFTLYFV